MADTNEPQELVRAFAERWRRDRAEGRQRTLEEYLALFPGDARAIATELLVLEARARTESGPDVATIGPYRTVREIGRGGQGSVYLAEDTRFGRRVALKVLNKLGALGEEVLARFRREALVASRLNHPGICGVLDAEIEAGIPYIAMPLLEGQTLAALIRSWKEGPPPAGADTQRKDAPSSAADDTEWSLESVPDDTSTQVVSDSAGPPPTTRPMEDRSEDPETVSTTSVGRKQIGMILEVFERAARALHAAHEAGVIHRDLKPANVMISPDGSPVLLDFGLALDEGGDLETLTQTGELFGTPAYMSPEQLSRGDLRLDRRTDVYSLGVALFEALALQRPFEESSREALFNAILTRDAANVRGLNPRVPRDLSVVVAKSLEKDRERRYATAEELADELRRVRELQPIVARPIGPMTQTKRWAQRNPVVAALAAILLLVLSSATALTTSALVQRTGALEEMTRARDAEQGERETKERALAEYERLADTKRLTKARAEAELLWPVGPGLGAALARWQAEYAPLLAPERLAAHRAALRRLRQRAEPYLEADRERDFRSELAEIAKLESTEAGLLAEEGEAAAAKLAEVRDRLLRLREVTRSRRTWEFADADDAFRHEILAKLVSDLEDMVAEIPTSVRSSVARRIRRARRIAPLTVSSAAMTERWRATADRVRANPRYRLDAARRKRLGPGNAPDALYDENGSMRLPPQQGLIPLGPDPRSGLEEFLHLETHQHEWTEPLVSLPTRRAPTESDAKSSFELRPETGVILVLIPAGEFLMGAQSQEPKGPNHDPDAVADEGPPTSVAIAAYFLSKYELTQAQWERAARVTGAADATPSEFRVGRFANRPAILPAAVSASHPVEQIDWFMSTEWCRRTGLRLPTEAQWERAARAGQSGQIWPGGASPEDLVRLANISGAETKEVGPTWQRTAEHRDRYVVHAPVGSFEPNAFGLHDMAGNVWEWCQDRFAPYSAAVPRPGDGLRVAAGASSRVPRGGSFLSAASTARVSDRGDLQPAFRNNGLGLRPARPIEIEGGGG